MAQALQIPESRAFEKNEYTCFVCNSAGVIEVVVRDPGLNYYCLTTLDTFPQVWKTDKDKDTHLEWMDVFK